MEKTISVTEARQSLPQLTRQTAERMDRWVLTNKGVGETVLMSVAEYRSLRAAAELVRDPEALAASRRGFAELEEGRGLSLEQAFGGEVSVGEETECLQDIVHHTEVCAEGSSPGGCRRRVMGVPDRVDRSR